ncbi:hypothetical protein HYQ44_010732 [Verticillium longisporum]|nr:hypothetical protein HYQ44_010732 [Verticillium longisporum]
MFEPSVDLHVQIFKSPTISGTPCQRGRRLARLALVWPNNRDDDDDDDGDGDDDSQGQSPIAHRTLTPHVELH